MMRSATRKRRLVAQLQNGRVFDGIDEVLATLPVARKDEAKKRALVRGLRALTRLETIWYQQVRALADRLDKLPIKKKLVK